MPSRVVRGAPDSAAEPAVREARDPERSPGGGSESPFELGPTRRPCSTCSSHGDVARVVVVGDEVEAHQHMVAERAGNDVAPLDDDDAIAFQQR